MFHNAKRLRSLVLPICLLLTACPVDDVSSAETGVRSRKPDRGSYSPPVIDDHGLQPVEVVELDRPQPVREPVRRSATPPTAAAERPVQQVTYESTAQEQIAEEATAPMPTATPPQSGGAILADPMHVYSEPAFDLACDAAPIGLGGACCDGSGCDAIGCGSCRGDSWHKNLFGSAELLLMFRKGDFLPPLASDGELGDTTTSVFAGSEAVFEDMTAGGRLSIGFWLDRCKDRHLVSRLWFAGEESFDFNGDQNTHPVLTRPFFNVTDGDTPAQDIQVIATPDRANGVLGIHGDSNVYGGDISIRQLWYKGYAGTIDLLYGYQYMGMDESLSISSRSTSLNDDFAPVGSVIAVQDSFDIDNDFNGGQIGVATNYREGCWSFSSLFKLGFGSVRRQADLRGATQISLDGNNAAEANGLLVRSTNRGSHDDSTFGWSPEIDLTFGWQQYPCFDVTFGYHIVAMTDALQLSGAIDPDLASNLAEPPTGAQRPSAQFRYDTFYVQGIHFGLSYIY